MQITKQELEARHRVAIMQIVAAMNDQRIRFEWFQTPDELIIDGSNGDARIGEVELDPYNTLALLVAHGRRYLRRTPSSKGTANIVPIIQGADRLLEVNPIDEIPALGTPDITPGEIDPDDPANLPRPDHPPASGTMTKGG